MFTEHLEIVGSERCLAWLEELIEAGFKAEVKLIGERQLRWIVVTPPPYLSGYSAKGCAKRGCNLPNTLPPCPLTAVFLHRKHRYACRGHVDWVRDELGIPWFVAEIFINAADDFHRQLVHIMGPPLEGEQLTTAVRTDILKALQLPREY